MNYDGVERRWRQACICNHLLEDRTPIIGTRRARLDVFSGDCQSVGLAVVADLPKLIGNREIVFDLTDGGDPSVQGYGHSESSPLWSFEFGGKTRFKSPASWAWMSSSSPATNSSSGSESESLTEGGTDCSPSLPLRLRRSPAMAHTG